MGHSVGNHSFPPLRVVQIVPGLVPGACGLGDYAVNLAAGLRECGVESHLVAAGIELADRADAYDGRGVPFTAVQPGSPAALLRALDDTAHDAVILHYSGYGYDPAGVPDWLADALAGYRRRSDPVVLTFLHETWQSPAWLSKRLYRSYFQRRTVRRLCRASQAIATNTSARAALLGRFHPDGCSFLPVFSNVGEVAGAKKVPGLAVIFGLPRRRRMAWSSLAARFDLVERLGITRILDIGAATFDLPARFQGMAERTGTLDASAASAALARADLTFMNYGSAELGKSGVFAAFAAHRLCVVNLGDEQGGEASGLTAGTHYLRPRDVDAMADPRNSIEATAAAGLDWYRPHDLARTSERFAAILRASLSARTLAPDRAGAGRMPPAPSQTPSRS